ncbi:CORVET complex membrane-binding subunit VPS8 LALA0_S04e00474g [Lachancea lanzarotensis]|uniref:LALA0S04e00474g1_1 n=1 Tax=Lachancea lanzarotensis TaxID=1245769 RepID=A0A0C7MW19_9SACH|nr:uncharacterized protein LALA0_S04e00474g [Lachancea lanzarotensis]CEP61780.1 LALA0S04e00474g1_1 [Lachancea lanzarotensis]
MDGDIHNEESFLDRRAIGLRETSQFPVGKARIPKDIGCDYDLLEDLRHHGIEWTFWVPLEKIYQNLTRYGRPSVVYPAFSYLAVGTSKGVITIFNHKQFLQMALLLDAGSSKSKVTIIRSSVDGTHIAASLESGDVFIWNLNRKTRNSDKIDGPREVTPILHISEHKFKRITGLGFLAERHTAVVVSDDSGTLSCYNGFRKGIWQLSYSTIGLNYFLSTQSSSVATSTYPGLSGAPFSDLQPVAVLSNSSLALVSASNFSQCYQAGIEKDIGIDPSIVWSACGTKLCYSGLHWLEVIRFERDGPAQKLRASSKVGWHCAETIKYAEWLSDSFLGVLTHSNEYMFISINNGVQQFEMIDLLPITLLSTISCPVVYFNRQLYALTNYNLQTGFLLSWSDIILKFVQSGEYISAIRSIRYFVTEEALPFNLLRLQDDVAARRRQFEQPLKNLSIASVRHVIRTQDINCDEVLLQQVLEESLRDYYLIFDDPTTALDFVEQALDQTPDECKNLFFSCLISLVRKRTITSLTPVVFSELLRSEYVRNEPLVLKHLFFDLDISTMDVDLAIELCKKLKFRRELIYLWTLTSSDYVTPFIEMLSLIGESRHENHLLTEDLGDDELLVYDYLGFVMTGRQFPLQHSIQPPTLSLDAELELCHILFSGALIDWPPKSGHKLYTCEVRKDEPAFPYMELLLNFDLRRCLGMLNEILEDSLFDVSFGDVEIGNGKISRSGVSRQFVMDFMIDRLKLPRPSHEKILTAIFVVRNLSKYPQFIRLSNTVIENLAVLLCTENSKQVLKESENAIEALIAGHYLSAPTKLIPNLKLYKFDRALLLVYKHAGAFSQMLALRIESKQLNGSPDSVLDVMRYCLKSTQNKPAERSAILGVVAKNIDTVVSVDVAGFIECMDKYDTSFHLTVFESASYSLRCTFLHQYFLSHNPTTPWELDMMSQYTLNLSDRGNEKELRELLARTQLSMGEYQRLLRKLKDSNSTYGALLVERQVKNFEGVVDNVIRLLMDRQGGTNCNELFDYAFEACRTAEGEQARNCWSRLLTFLLHLRNDQYQPAINRVFQELTKATADVSASALAFSLKDVVTGALESPDLILIRIGELAPTFCQIINAADINQNVITIISNIVNHSSAEVSSRHEKLLRSGWSIKSSDCAVCGEKLWGVDVSSNTFLAWREQTISSNIDATERLELSRLIIVLFDCQHGFHENCLKNLGQGTHSFKCLLCDV